MKHSRKAQWTKTYLGTPLWVWLLLASMSFILLLERLHTYGVPWFTDMVYFSTVGNGLLHGRSLYSDIWDIKPPAIYLTYALAEAVLGHTSYLLVWLGFLTASATLLALYAAGRALSGKAAGGLWAAGFWTLLATDLYLEGSQVNCESFMNLWLVLAFVLLVWHWKKGEPPGWAYALTGFFWALASFYKQFMAVEAIGLGLVVFLAAPRGKKAKVAKGLALAWGIACLLWLMVFAYFGATGRGQIFWDTLVTYGRFYSEDILSNFEEALRPQYFLPGWFWFFVPLGLLSLAAVGMAYRRKPWMALVFLTFLSLKFFEKAMPGRLFRHHYYQLWIPALCLGAGWGLCLIGEKYSKKISLALGGILLLALTGYEAQGWAISPEDWNRENYGFDYVGVDQVVGEVDRLLKPNEEFYEWDEYPRFYFACDRSTPTGVLFGMHLFNGDPYSGGPFAAELTDRTLKDLERNQPEMVIWDRGWTPEGWNQNPVAVYLVAHYRPFAACGLGGRFELQCRDGGNLDARLRALASPAAGPAPAKRRSAS